MKTVKMAFLKAGKVLPIQDIYSLRQIKAGLKKSRKYHRILASIKEVGVIEPLIVYPDKNCDDKYYLLDGHMRLEALKDTGATEVSCLVSTDDEAFTYNHKVNRLSPIQEHFMILKALENGVSEERIATALNIDIVKIKQKRNLLTGICQEAVDLLKDKQVSRQSFQILKKMKPMRQIEVAELMRTSNNYSFSYAQVLLISSHKKQLHNQYPSKKQNDISITDIKRIEKEMETIEADFKTVQTAYGHNVLNLTLSRSYLQKILKNNHILMYLKENHQNILEGFQEIIESTSLEN
ncbi:plasmid partitioning protein RepB C-terminal domain-containing protein [Solidesulfovibrio sp. C21]|uniref:plasmid partitioning protein RepB C-terminal domain-containing protein n=1 Tax=Solidesulfovibrio sp. C21 TaxID=3398613 RepID=UPI0039FC3706